MTDTIYIYILIMGAVTFLIRVLPLTLIRGEIKSEFLRSFLYYVPYVTLSVMTFPAIIKVTSSLVPGIFALAIGIYLAYKDKSLFKVAAYCCIVALAAEIVMGI